MQLDTELPESLKNIIELLIEKKAVDVQILKVTDLVSYADYFVVCSGTSSTHLRTLSESIAALIKIPGVGGVRMEGNQTSNWVLIDGGDYILHMFLPEARKFYNLEQLWEDAPRIAL